MTRSDRSRRGVAALAAVGAAALWGTTGTASALGPTASDPASVGSLRIAVGALALLALAAPVRRRVRASARRIDQTGSSSLLDRLPDRALLGLGGLAVAAYQLCFFLGVARAGVAVGTVIALGVAPVATGALGMLLGERVTRRWALSTAGALAGVLILASSSGAGPAGGAAAGVDVLGVVAAIGAGVAYSGYAIAARALIVRGMPGARVMAGFFTIGALTLAPVLLQADLTWVLTLRGAAMVLWLGLVATGLSYLLFQRALSVLPAGSVATISLAEPVTATLLGVGLLGERLSWLTTTGIAVVVVSLFVVTVRPVGPRPEGSQRGG